MRRVIARRVVLKAMCFMRSACAAWLWLAVLGVMPALADNENPLEEPVRGAPAPLPVRVMVINLFGMEAAPWLAALNPTIDVPVPGLSSDYPQVKCTSSGVCEMTTGMGHGGSS
jgi:purine nucleoside permease